MLARPETEAEIVALLEEYTGCTVVLANQTSPMPEYPYISYTITTPVHAQGGTYCITDGEYYLPMLQTWSFTVQSGDYNECMKKGMRMYDFFAQGGIEKLQKINVAVSSKTNLTSRDNFLTIRYEYRCGMDVVFRLPHIVEMTDGEIKNELMHISMNGKEVN
jgi:hypothetical protein